MAEVLEQDAAAVGVPAAAVARRRRRQVERRSRAVTARFSVEEFEVLQAAAGARGLTVTAYVASVGVGTARGEVHPLPAGVGDVVRELVEARTQLRRYGVLLNQAVAKLNALGEVDESLGAALVRCEVATASVRSAVERVGAWRAR